MTRQPRRRPAPKRILHHTQVRLAFLADQVHKACPAVLTSVEGNIVSIHYLGGETARLSVGDPERLAGVLAGHDLCRVQEHPLLLVNTHHGVLGVATGPSSPPSQLEVLIVSRLENGSVVELVAPDATQPSWQLFSIVDAE